MIGSTKFAINYSQYHKKFKDEFYRFTKQNKEVCIGSN